MQHDLVTLALAVGDLRHLAFELGGHVGCGDGLGELFERVDDGDAELGGLDGIVHDVMAAVEALDHVMARGLSAKPLRLHLLNELARRVARWRLGLLVRAIRIPEVERLAFDERGHLLVLLEAVRIHAAIARLDKHVAASGEGLALDIERDLGGLEDGGLRQRRHEAPADETVELPFLGTELVGIGRARGVDGRVVGRLLLAARGRELALGEQRLGPLAKVGDLGEDVENPAQVEPFGVDRVVDAGIRGVAVHVERFGDAHGARRLDADGARRRHERGGVERSGRIGLAALLLDGADGRLGRTRDAGHDAVCLALVLEARGGVRRGEGIVVLVLGRGGTGDDPVVLRNEGVALLLALDHEGQRGGLHTTGGARVADAAVLHAGEVACEHGTPDEIDVLARLARVRKVIVERLEFGGRERVLDLLLDEGGVTGARNGRGLVYLADHGDGIEADELTLAVEVGGDDDLIGLLGEVLERADDVLLGRQLDDGHVGEVGQRGNLPALEVDALGNVGTTLGFPRRGCERLGHVRRIDDLAVLLDTDPTRLLLVDELLGEIEPEDMALEPDGNAFVTIAIEAVHGRVVDLVRLGLAPLGKETGDLLRCDVFLGNDQFHVAHHSLVFAAFLRTAMAYNCPWRLHGRGRKGLSCSILTIYIRFWLPPFWKRLAPRAASCAMRPAASCARAARLPFPSSISCSRAHVAAPPMGACCARNVRCREARQRCGIPRKRFRFRARARRCRSKAGQERSSAPTRMAMSCGSTGSSHRYCAPQYADAMRHIGQVHLSHADGRWGPTSQGLSPSFGVRRGLPLSLRVKRSGVEKSPLPPLGTGRSGQTRSRTYQHRPRRCDGAGSTIWSAWRRLWRSVRDCRSCTRLQVAKEPTTNVSWDAESAWRIAAGRSRLRRMRGRNTKVIWGRPVRTLR